MVDPFAILAFCVVTIAEMVFSRVLPEPWPQVILPTIAPDLDG